MSEPILLQSFQGKNTRIPVWFMRQAGRYLPEYRKIKSQYTLEEMFRNPEIASRITCLPISILGVDAAILFADILTMPAAMGFQITFDKTVGPIIANPIQNSSDINQIHDLANLDYVWETIKLTNEQLPSHIPLIGFAGSPFTIACYLIEGGSSLNFTRAFQFAYENPQAFKNFLGKLTVNTIEYLNQQKNAGIKAFQIFDTWAGMLRQEDFNQWVLPYVKQIFKAVKLPSIYYVKHCAHLLESMDQTGADFLGVCQTVALGQNEVLSKTKKGVQGNLFNGLLYCGPEKLRSETLKVLKSGRNYPRYIFNLSHGIFPDIKVDQLKLIVETVKQFPLK